MFVSIKYLTKDKGSHENITISVKELNLNEIACFNEFKINDIT